MIASLLLLATLVRLMLRRVQRAVLVKFLVRHSKHASCIGTDQRLKKAFAKDLLSKEPNVWPEGSLEF